MGEDRRLIMNNDALNPNFEWKKKSFGKKERLSRRIDANQAELSDFKKKNNIIDAVPLTAQASADFNRHLNKMRKKIKQAADDEEDEDEDDFINVSPLSLSFEEFNESSLFESLNNQEKMLLAQKQTLQNMTLQKDASKLQALDTVNKLAKKNGLNKLSQKALSETMQSSGWGKETFRTTIEHYLAPDVRINRKLDPQKIEKLMVGLKRLKKIGGFSAVQGMKINDVISITDKKYNDSKVAQLLLKKTGRKANLATDKKWEKKQTHPSKISFKKLLQQRREQPLTKA